jgi:hypothetical protein
VSSTVRSKKVRNLAHDSRVSIALEGGGEPVVAEGHAVLVQDFPPEILAAFQAKYGWDAADPEPEGPHVLIRIPVSRWLLAGTAQ